MNPRLLVISIACGAALLATAACGGDDDAATSTATAPNASATASVAATPRATVPATSASATPLSSTPAGTPPPATPSGTATASVTPPAGTIFVPAPIDAAEILVLESFPVQYTVHITSGLPSGCHEYDHTDVERNDPQIMIYVMNRLPDDKDLACTAIYGQKETTVPLGSDFVSGTTYKVQVNERALEFTAQ
jgi:hypothetical protein